MKLIRRLVLIVLIAAVGVGIVFMVTTRNERAQRFAGRGNPADQPVPVLAAEARIADVPVYLIGVGTVRALNMVTVRSLVNGTLIRVAFHEGQDVKRGDVLAAVDPTIYKASLDQAVAKKALDEALLANARVDLERYAGLVKSNAVNKQQYDTQKALVDQDEAQVKLDQGAIDNARAYVDWCTITSPIDGRTGIRQVDQGNIVSTTDLNGIVVVTQIQPIAMIFNLPQQQLPQVNTAFAKGPLTVEAAQADNRTVLDTGTLQVVNNQVDQTTGTVQYKAEFPNKNLQLWPGQFVNVRLLIDTLHDVVVVPTAAVQRGPNGTFVYLVQPDDTVKVALVTVTQQDETQAVIATGLAASDRVVTSGFSQLADGRKVSIAGPSGRPAPQAGSPPSGPARRDGATASERPGEPRNRRSGNRSETATP